MEYLRFYVYTILERTTSYDIGLCTIAIFVQKMNFTFHNCDQRGAQNHIHCPTTCVEHANGYLEIF